MAKVLSIEISNSLIRICQMDYKKKNPRVYRHTVVQTPQGAVSDGYLINTEELKSTIKAALKENKMKTKDVIFTIASSKIVTREVLLPAVKEKMIPSLIKTNLNEYFPIDLSAYEIAHLVLEKIAEGNDAGKYKTLIMAAEKTLVESYDRLAADCGLKLMSLDYVGNSIYQAIKNEDKDARVMVLKIEENQTTVTVVKNKNLVLQRSIAYGLGEVIDEITKNRVFGVTNYDDAWDLAKRKTCIKFNFYDQARRQNYERDTEYDAQDIDESAEIRAAKFEVTKSMEPLVGSIRRVIEFYSSRNAGEAVDRILISGMGAGMSGISKLLTNELGIKTTVLNRLEGVGWHVVGDDTGIFNFVACIGAGLDPIGFISKEKKAQEKKETDYTRTIVLFIIAVIVMSAAMFSVPYMNYLEVKEEEARLKQKEALYMESEKSYQIYNNMLALYQQVEEGSSLIETPNDNLLIFLEELEQTLPSDVEVTSFASDGTTASIAMRVANKSDAAGVISKVREFDSLMGVSVANLVEIYENETEEENEEAVEEQMSRVPDCVEFTLVCTYYPSGYSKETEQ